MSLFSYVLCSAIFSQALLVDFFGLDSVHFIDIQVKHCTALLFFKHVYAPLEGFFLSLFSYLQIHRSPGRDQLAFAAMHAPNNIPHLAHETGLLLLFSFFMLFF